MVECIRKGQRCYRFSRWFLLPMDRVSSLGIHNSSKHRKIIAQGVIGLALIILSGKFVFDLYSSTQVKIDLNGKPALLFITDDQPCECAKKLITEADFQ